MLHPQSGIRIVAAAAAVLLSTVLIAPPSFASNFVGMTAQTGCNHLNMANPNPHRFFYVDLKDYYANQTTWERVNAIDPTDVNTVLQSSQTGSTDVLVRDRYYTDYCGKNWWQPGSGGVVGIATCDVVQTIITYACELHTVRYSNTWGDQATVVERRKLACHENGHALGLAHRGNTVTDTCMKTNLPLPSTTFDNHDRSHLNADY